MFTAKALGLTVPRTLLARVMAFCGRSFLQLLTPVFGTQSACPPLAPPILPP
jgi:hypothetical protein